MLIVDALRRSIRVGRSDEIAAFRITLRCALGCESATGWFGHGLDRAVRIKKHHVQASCVAWCWLMLCSECRDYCIDSSIALLYSSSVMPSIAGSTSSVSAGASITLVSPDPQPVSVAKLKQQSNAARVARVFIGTPDQERLMEVIDNVR